MLGRQCAFVVWTRLGFVGPIFGQAKQIFDEELIRGWETMERTIEKAIEEAGPLAWMLDAKARGEAIIEESKRRKAERCPSRLPEDPTRNPFYQR